MRTVSAILRSFPSVMQAFKFKWLFESIKVLSYLLAMLKSPGKVSDVNYCSSFGMFLQIRNFANCTKSVMIFARASTTDRMDRNLNWDNFNKHFYSGQSKYLSNRVMFLSLFKWRFSVLETKSCKPKEFSYVICVDPQLTHGPGHVVSWFRAMTSYTVRVLNGIFELFFTPRL